MTSRWARGLGRLVLGAIAFALLASSDALAATYVVAPPPVGSDANPGTNGAPFATIQKAVDVAVAGDTILVRSGGYAGAKFVTSGLPGAPITLRGEPGAVVSSVGPINNNIYGLWISKAEHIVIENIEVTSVPGTGIVVAGSFPTIPLLNGIVVRNTFVHDTGFGGISVSFTTGCIVIDCEVANIAGLAGLRSAGQNDNLLFTRNLIRNCALSGIEVALSPGSDSTSNQATIDGNTLTANGSGGGAAILLAAANKCLIVNNLLFGNLSRGIQHTRAASGVGSYSNRLINNTVVQPSVAGYPLSLVNGSGTISVHNNILLHEGGLGSIEVDTFGVAALQSDNNVLREPLLREGSPLTLVAWQARGFDSNSILATSDELFANPGSGDFELHATSPAIDAGRPVSGASHDIRGVSRPQGDAFDIGAYEFGADDPPPPNRNPIAVAGDDRMVTGGAVVVLSGALSSDPDMDALSFAWTQASGPAVALTGAETATASFVAPTANETLDLEFALTVSDGRGGSASDTVLVHVARTLPAPTIQILKPTAGQVWRVGQKKQIKFAVPQGTVGDVRFELSRDGGQTFETVIASVPVAKGKKKWTVTGPATTAAIVRVVLNQNADVYGVMPTPFVIEPQ